MITESLQAQVIACLEDIPHSGLLIHGSYARGSEDWASDVDVLCLLTTLTAWSAQRTYDTLSLDLYGDSVDNYGKAAFRDNGNNNNWVLSAFVHGQVVQDSGEQLSTLKARAIDLWNAGPKRPDDAERRSIQLLWEKYTISAESLIKKQHRSVEWSSNVHYQAFRYFKEKVDLYCRHEAIWSAAPCELLLFRGEAYKALQDYIRRFLCANSIEDKVRQLNVLDLPW